MKPTESRQQIVKIETARAANHDFADVRSAASTAKPQASGWDPVEVWRRMISEPRQRRTTEQHSS